eukprot:scaffold23_cov113-Isochrysis_galbana.AAC.14
MSQSGATRIPPTSPFAHPSPNPARAQGTSKHPWTSHIVSGCNPLIRERKTALRTAAANAAEEWAPLHLSPESDCSASRSACSRARFSTAESLVISNALAHSASSPVRACSISRRRSSCVWLSAESARLSVRSWRTRSASRSSAAADVRPPPPSADCRALLRKGEGDEKAGENIARAKK